MPATLLILITLKATVLLSAAWLLTRVLARRSAASRHLVWTLALLAVLALPVMQVGAPSWKLPVLPAAAGADLPLQPEIVRPRTEGTQSASATAGPMWDVAAAPAAVTNTPPPRDPAWTLDWRVALALLWLSGLVVALTRLAAGLVWVRRVTQRAGTVTDPEWTAAFAETTAALRITSDVSLKVSADTTVPVACGIFASTVLLPMDAAAWPADRRRVVLLHELAHVARRDCLVQTLGQLARAVHWFNPLAHVAVLQLRAEQERACDDLVLVAGTDAQSYADHLFEIARSFRSGGGPAWATLAMARPSQLEGRVLAILDDRRDRCAPARRTRAAVGVAAAALALPIAVLQPTAAEPLRVQPRPTAMRAAPSTAIAPSQGTSDPVVQPVRWNDAAFVEAAIEFVEVIADVDFNDFDFDWYGPLPAAMVGRSSFADVAPDPDPNPEHETIVVPGGNWSKAQSQSSSQSQNAQSGQNNTVSDETRRRVADALMTALNDENPEVREQALNALADMRDARAIPGLLRALRDTEVDVREQAINALARFDTPEALDGIISALKDPSPDVRQQATRHLASVASRDRLSDAKYSGVVSALLKDSSPDVRRLAIVALRRMGGPESVPLLLPLLKDMDAEVREQAAIALGVIADPRAIDALTAALKDQTPHVREQAAIALGRIARGQRRGPGVSPPSVIVKPPQGVRLDADEIIDIATRAQEEAQRQLQQNLEQLERQLR